MKRTGWWRSTVRTRLTLLYAGAFLVAGLALVALMYLYLGQVLDRQLVVRTEFTRDAAGIAVSPQSLIDQAQQVIGVQLRQARSNTLDTMLVASLIIVAILGLGAGVVGWVVAGQALQPLRNITATARRVADRSLHERIGLKGPQDEIKDLADTLDAMLERLDRSFDSQRRFVANASHELRTPLTITRTLLEVALLEAPPDSPVRQLAGTLLAVNQRHERLTDGLLALAASEQRGTDLRPVEMAELAGYVATELKAIAAKDRIDIRMDLQPALVLGDPFLLERLVQNLVENAIRYNLPNRGWTQVATGTSGGQAFIAVENTGPKVPPYEVPSLFEPFRRLSSSERLADPSRPRGAGLGLSIVRSIAIAHGGEVHATSREEGGLLVRVALPAMVDGRADERPVLEQEAIEHR
jgi:signal transduction histidine kinase